MIGKELILKLFDASYMLRWNDKVRPMDLYEIDKQSHKMFIAFFLGKFQENKPGFNWVEIIEAGIFELLQRIVLTDLKPKIFDMVKREKGKYAQLNAWVYKQLEPYLQGIDKNFHERFKQHFKEQDNNVNKRIISAAHIYASYFEFKLIRPLNQSAYDIHEIEKDFKNALENYYDLEGMKQLKLYENNTRFIGLCGDLRYQYRWANLHRVPRTSVLGHSLMVAMLSYFLSKEIDASDKRVYYNFFTGLFHDLPEVLTRDVISPVKRAVEGLDEMIKDFEHELLHKWIYDLIPEQHLTDIKLFSESEFDNFVIKDGKRIQDVTSEEISEKYNNDSVIARDGKIVKTSDELSAFVEAYSAMTNGIMHKTFIEATEMFRDKYKNVSICGKDISKIYDEFETLHN